MTLAQEVNGYRFAGLKHRRPRPRHLEKAVEKVERAAEGLEVPNDLENFDYLVAFSELTSGQASRRQVKRLAAGGLSQIEEMKDGKAVLGSLLAAVDAFGRGLLKSLLIGYLMAQKPDSWALTQVRRFLLDRKATLPLIWRNRVTEYALLSSDLGLHCSQKILDAEAFDATLFASESGLKGVKGAGGVGYKVFQALSKSLSTKHDGNRLGRYLELVTMDSNIRFRSHLGDYAAALLAPYLSTAPSDENRARIEDFLVNNFGDPRINPVAWRVVTAEYVDVLKRWLAKASLELLLNVVSASNDTKQWEQRFKFWAHYFDQGLITDAWVALGPAASIEADRLVRAGELSSAADFGLLFGDGVQPDHSVIMFRLGDFTITEWTHSGKVRIYDLRNEKTPRFYQRSYNTLAIRNDKASDLALVHHLSWRERLSGYINFELGLSAPKGIKQVNQKRTCTRCRQNLHVQCFANEDTNRCSRCGGGSAYG